MTVSPPVVGARAEAAVASALVRAGKAVFLPAFGAHSRVDLVYDDGQQLVRVQCKTSRLVDGGLSFRTCSNTGQEERSYMGEADMFGVYSPDLDRVYLVPVAEMPSRKGFLRLSPAKNGQQHGVRWANDYLLGRP